MRLTLSSRHPRNSVYTTENDQVPYKVNKPRQLGCGVATIRKAVKTVNGVWEGELELKPGAKSTFLDTEAQENDKPGKDDHWSMSSRNVMFSNQDPEDGSGPDTNELSTADEHFAFYSQGFFRKEGWSWYGRGRVFTASDGQEYRWDLRIGHLKMFKNDGSKEPLVKFFEHHFPLGPVVKGRPATLELDDSCIAILDEIIMTFVYCHKLRKDGNEGRKTVLVKSSSFCRPFSQ